MASLTNQDEQRLLTGVKKAVELVDNEGMTPDDALHKVAVDQSFTPGFLKAACVAFNTGRQLAQWNANDSVLDKLANFPLANYQTVSGKIWGEEPESSTEKKASIGSVTRVPVVGYGDRYRRELMVRALPAREKTACASEEDQAAKLLWHAYKNTGRHLAEARREKNATQDSLNYELYRLESYFKKSAYDRLPLAAIDAVVRLDYGDAGAALMDHVAANNPREKRAADHSAGWAGFTSPVDRTQQPYTIVSELIRLGKQANSCNIKLAAATTAHREAELAFSAKASPRDAVDAKQAAVLSMSLFDDTPAAVSVKQASIFDTFRDFSSQVRDRADKSVEDQIRSLESPDHVNELRKIRANTALTSMLSDSDNPLSEYDPEQVLQAYNELTQLSPSIADQPGALQPLLQKRLMGNTEPFEVSETLKLEEGLQKTHPNVRMPAQAPVNIMKNESSLLG